MGLKDRLREIRKNLPKKTTQEAFAESLGTTRNAIASYELGKVIPTDTFIQLLCAKFNISEEWLRTGAGPMHKSDIEAQVDAYTRGYALDAEEREIIRYFLNLNPPERAAMIAHVEKLADAVRAARPAATSEHTPAPAVKTADSTTKKQHTIMDEGDDEIEADVAAYRAALIAEKEAASASSSTAAAKRA